MILLAAAFAGQPTCDEMTDAEKTVIADELEAMVQQLRKSEPIRKDQLKRVMKLDKAKQLCSPMEVHNAAAVYGTTFEPEHLERAYALATEAQQAHAAGSGPLVAQTYDRLLVSQDLGQVFLTQLGTLDTGKPCLHALGEVADDKKRAVYGLGPAKPIYAEILMESKRAGDPTPKSLETWGLYCKPVGTQAQRAKR